MRILLVLFFIVNSVYLAYAKSEASNSAVVETKPVEIPTIKGSLTYAEPEDDYIVGPNDSLYINVYGQQNLGSPLFSSGNSQVQGSRVDGKGNIQLPLIGSLHAEGLTTEQLRLRLMNSFSKYIKNPWVVVEIADYKSHPVYLVGEFNKPGITYMDRPVNLLQAISMGQGLNEQADIRNARLIRDNKVVPVDIYELIKRGDMSQNIPILKGDTLYFPDNKLQRVFVLGEVQNPGEVRISHGFLTLSQAIASAGGLSEISYNKSGVKVIRSNSTTKGELITVNLKDILKGKASPFPLQEGDIVYVGKSKIGNWTQFVNEITPTLRGVGYLLSPFTTMLFLL